MRTTTNWGAHCRAAAGAMALGAMMAGAQAQVVTCPGNSCDVTVTVTGTPAAPVVRVSATELRMQRGARNPVITWKLDAADYEFRQESIRPYTGPSVPGKQSTTKAAWDDQCTRLNTSGTAIRIRNQNSKAVTLTYDVTVFHKATGRSFTLDPALVNDP